MLRYLTNKLRTQSLNENELEKKANDDHDSGTESDDESANIEELQKYMENSILLGGSGRGTRSQFRRGSTGEVASSDAAGGECGGVRGSTFVCRARTSSRAGSKTDTDSPFPEAALDSALPSDSDHNFDHHSSEEELEVINRVGRERNASGSSGGGGGGGSSRHQRVPPLSEGLTGSSAGRGGTVSASLISQYPEKRKWSQANGQSFGENSGSSDEELKDLVCFSTPVEFRTSPPANVHKPSRSLSPPPKVFHSASANIPPVELCSASPRKRHRRTPTVNGAHAAGPTSANIQRPCLDFEKMQQCALNHARKRKKYSWSYILESI